MHALPDSKQTIRSLRNIAAPIQTLEAKRAPLASQLDMMKNNGIDSGRQYDRLARDIASIEQKLAPLIARRTELEAPFRKVRAHAVAETEARKEEFARLDHEAIFGPSEYALNAKIEEAISELVKSGLSEKAARKSPIVIALEEKRPEYKAKGAAARQAVDAVIAETTGLIARCDVVLEWSSPMPETGSKPPSFAMMTRSRVIAFDVFAAAFAVASYILHAHEGSKTGHILFTIHATVLGLVALIATAMSLRENGNRQVHSSWWPFIGVCVLTPILLWIDFQPFNSDAMTPGWEGLINLAVFIFGGFASGYAFAGIPAHFDWKLESGEREKSREEEIKDGLDKLKRDVENDIIEYGKN
jgi:uncharacterized membrane-anchored protein